MDVDGALLDTVTALLGANLVGLYDVRNTTEDGHGGVLLVIVVARDLTRDRTYGLVQTLLHHSTDAAPIAALVVRADDLLACQPSVLVQLQYTEADRPTLATAVGSTAWLRWPDGPAGSVDRGELLTRLQAGARTVVGRPLQELLQAIVVSSATTYEGASPAPSQQHPLPPARQLPFA